MVAPPSKGPSVSRSARRLVGAAQTVSLSSFTPVNGAILRNRISEPYVPDVYNLSRRLQGFYRDSPDDGADQRARRPPTPESRCGDIAANRAALIENRT